LILGDALALTKEASGKIVSCGIIMAISAIDGCDAQHWSEVKSIIVEACHSIDDPEFEAKLVSEGDNAEVLHKKIVPGVYSSDTAICDVSGRNPNVMFELGLRIAFDKPTIIIKDDETPFSFDTAPVQHLDYPRNLKFAQIVEFKKILAEKVKNTYVASSAPGYETVLKSFGPLQTVRLDETSVPLDELLIEMVAELQRDVAGLRSEMRRSTAPSTISPPRDSAIYSTPNFMAGKYLEKAIRAGEVKFGREFWNKKGGMGHLFNLLEGHIRPTGVISSSNQLIAAVADCLLRIEPVSELPGPEEPSNRLDTI
jgi:hypothetical protein